MQTKTLRSTRFLHGKKLDEAIVQKASELARKRAKPLTDIVYKVKMAQDLSQCGLLMSVYLLACSVPSGIGMMAHVFPLLTTPTDSGVLR